MGELILLFAWLLFINFAFYYLIFFSLSVSFVFLATHSKHFRFQFLYFLLHLACKIVFLILCVYLFINFLISRFTKNCKMTPKAKFEWTTHENKFNMQLNNNRKCTKGSREREREEGGKCVCGERWEKLIKNYAIFYLAWNTLRMRNVNAWNWTDRNCLYDSVCVTVRLSVCAWQCVSMSVLYCVWLANRLIVSATITFLITSALKFQQQNIAESH